MKNILAIEKVKIILMAILMITFGVLFICLPETSFDVVVSILAWSLIILGAVWIVTYFLNATLVVSAHFVNGALCFGMGLLLLFVPSIYIAIIGLALSFIGLQYVGNAIEQKRAHAKGWWKDLLYGIVELVLGIVLVILRYSTVTHSALMICFGVLFILNGLFILIATYAIKKIAVDAQKIVEHE